MRPIRFALLLTAAFTAGCGGNDFQKVYPVKGKVTVDGQPAAECLVHLHRTFDDAHPRKVVPYALTDAAGEFQITSYVTGDGAPEGEYVVTIEWKTRSGVLGNNFDGPDLLSGAFANKEANKAKPGFTVKVGKEPLQLQPFEIKLSAEERRKMGEVRKRSSAKPQIGGDR